MTNASDGRLACYRPIRAPHPLSRFSTAIIIKIAYGHELKSDDDRYLNITEQIGAALNNSGPVGNTPVDWLPFRESTTYSGHIVM